MQIHKKESRQTKLWKSWLEQCWEFFQCALIISFDLYLRLACGWIDYAFHKIVWRFLCLLCKEEELKLWSLTTRSYAVNGMTLHVVNKYLRSSQCSNSHRTYSDFLKITTKWKRQHYQPFNFIYSKLPRVMPNIGSWWISSKNNYRNKFLVFVKCFKKQRINVKCSLFLHYTWDMDFISKYKYLMCSSHVETLVKKRNL